MLTLWRCPFLRCVYVSRQQLAAPALYIADECMPLQPKEELMHMLAA